MLFGGFQKCLYPLVKFDSDSERRFAVILERDAEKWFRPAKGQFQIYYKLGTEQPEYVPDFVVEAAEKIYMVETKASTDMKTRRFWQRPRRQPSGAAMPPSTRPAMAASPGNSF